MKATVERCSRCRRSFGGHFTFRRAHPNGRCRPVRELRGIGLRLNDEGNWVRPGPTDPVQLRLPLFGRGRPRKRGASAIYPRARRLTERPPLPGATQDPLPGVLWPSQVAA